jgi:hypothetical protein
MPQMGDPRGARQGIVPAPALGRQAIFWNSAVFWNSSGLAAEPVKLRASVQPGSLSV